MAQWLGASTIEAVVSQHEQHDSIMLEGTWHRLDYGNLSHTLC